MKESNPVKRSLRHFLPHPQTHQKSPFLSWHYLLIYVLLFILLQTSLSLFSLYKPGVLGINSQLEASKIIEETNKERQRNGLPALIRNVALDSAAGAKAKNMFEENYWAHFSPSGKDPWQFVLASGYRFSYAGENLAKNFYQESDLVKAWLNSPSHRDNLLSAKYQDVGLAVAEGVINGQRTILVVQLFGKPYEPLAKLPEVSAGGSKTTLSLAQLNAQIPTLVAGAQQTRPPAPALIDPYFLNKTVGGSLVAFIGLLLVVDLLVLKRRGVFRVSSHHFTHLGFLVTAGAAVLSASPGAVL